MDILFVCSGNTCRSPMAQCLFNDLCKKRGLPYRAESAGMYAREGDVATDGAFEAMKEHGLSLARHTARPLTPMIVRDVRLVAAMGENLAQAIRQKYPNARVIVFQPPISDPYGGSIAVYRATADELCSRMDWVLKQLELLKEQR